MKFGEGLQLVAGILIVILAAYYATYFIANKKSKRMPGKGINIRERFALSKDKMVCVVETNGRAYLVVITNGGATLLDTFDIEEYETYEEEKTAGEQEQQPAYVPNGIIAGGIWKLFNSFKRATTAKTVYKRREIRRDSDGFNNPDVQSSDRYSGKADYTIRVAREEDAIDEIQRRLNNRRVNGAPSNQQGAPRDE